MSEPAPLDDVTEELYEIILRYKSAISSHTLFEISEREADRRHLISLEAQIESLKQKVLDSRAYLQLGRMQGEVNRMFLAAGTTPMVRMRMLARIVSRLTTPVVHVAGRGEIAWGRFRTVADSGFPEGEEIHEGEVEGSNWNVRQIRARAIDERERSVRRQKVQALYSGVNSYQELRGCLDADRAEILSQLFGSGELTSPPAGFFGEDDTEEKEPVSFLLHVSGDAGEGDRG